jgi:hypothetical protein
LWERNQKVRGKDQKVYFLGNADFLSVFLIPCHERVTGQAFEI